MLCGAKQLCKIVEVGIPKTDTSTEIKSMFLLYILHSIGFRFSAFGSTLVLDETNSLHHVRKPPGDELQQICYVHLRWTIAGIYEFKTPQISKSTKTPI